VAIDKKTVKLQIGATTATAYYFQPQGLQPAVGIVALHARAGLTDSALREAENLARIGCGVLALDYFEGAKPATPPVALHLMATLGGAVAQQKIAAAQAWLRETQHVEKVVVLGWGDGGALALNAGLASTPPDAVATFYGDLPAQYTTVTQQLARNKVAVLGFFAKRDAWVTPARVNAFDEALSQAGVDHLFVSFAVAPEFVFDPNPASQSYAATARNTLHDFMARRGARF
jgi:carboxymethylenebutenolidase